MASWVERVFIGLGSNLGNGKEVLSAAWRAIGEVDEIVTVSLSHPYVSAPVAMTSTNWFTNAVGELKTSLPPRQVLKNLLQIEAAFGRTRNERALGYEDRTLDLDILYYNDITVTIPELVLPHPRVQDRLFVLRPLVEIAPELWSRVHAKTVREMEAELVAHMAQGRIPLQEISRGNWE
jgi:2-amino-4-hydroxy-6-hydroxymethyldihydropteridine diphosphokinase